MTDVSLARHLLGRTPRPSITEQELWQDVTRAVRRLAKTLRYSLLVYISRQNDKRELTLVAADRERNAVSIVSLPSLADVAALGSGDAITIPGDLHLQWLVPLQLFGAEQVLLLGHDTVVGRLIVLVLLDRPDDHPSAAEVATLKGFFHDQLVSYIDNALSAIDLDSLTAEVGHLMGRAIGRISVGTAALSEILHRSNIDDESLPMALNSIQDGLVRLELIRNNFYAFSAQRRTSDGVGFDASFNEVFDVTDILRAMKPLFEREAVERDLKRPHVKLSRRSAKVTGPPALFRLVLLNLYDNAIKFAYAKTFVNLALTVSDTHCHISIENLGIGVAPNENSLVFRSRYRSRFRDPRRRIEGLGLGLSFCRRVVEDVLSGSISLASRPVHTVEPRRFEGDNWLTTVSISLPLQNT